MKNPFSKFRLPRFNLSGITRRGKRRAPKKPRNINKVVPTAATPKPKKSQRQMLVQWMVVQFVALLAVFVVSVTGLSQVYHAVQQSQLLAQFKDELAAGTAPTGEVDFENYILEDGVPVAIIKIPKIHLYEVVVEGTDVGTLRSGAGHRRDTVLPGQVGNSVIMGRAAAFGGPFGAISTLSPGDKFIVFTAQGKQTYEVLGTRQQKEYSPPPLEAGQSRLTLVTARGLPFAPSGLMRVDANLVSTVQPSGPRVTSTVSVPAIYRELSVDASGAWMLVMALQLLLLVEIGALWSLARMGMARTWIVFTPLLMLSLILTMDQVTRLLPNLL